MKQNLTLFVVIFLATIFFSCSKVNDKFNFSNVTRIQASNIESAKFTNRNVFGVAFARALGQSKQLNILVKGLANEKFDGTTDVLYSELMTKVVEGKMANDYIKQFANDKELFQNAVDQSPLLTIYIPRLPSGWSNETWNPTSESVNIVIAKDLLDTKSVMNYYDKEGKLSQISDRLIPSQPTLVIKENARLILKPDADLIKRTYSKESDMPIFYKNLNGKDLYFLTDRFLHPQKETLSKTLPSKRLNTSSNDAKFKNFDNPIMVANPQQMYQEWKDAYTYFGTSWPRDYIYFGLTPSNTNGFFNNRWTENIYFFSFSSASIYPQISTESGDPKVIPQKTSTSDPSWTSGSYQFTFTIYVNAKNGIGVTIKKVQSVNPEDLWNVTYKQYGWFYEFDSLSPKNYMLNLDLLPFDITNYSVAWKITVEDTRPSETITTTNNYTSTFSENFSLDPTGILKKIGLKFGTTATQSSTQSHTVATTYTSVGLGDMVLGFQDPIITGVTKFFIPIYLTNSYSTGSVVASIYPEKQW